MPDPFDWSFDGFKASSSAVRDKLYMECSRYHPEMLDRDLMPRSASGASIARATEVTPRHSFDTTSKSSVNTTPRTSLDRTPRTVSARSSLDVTPRNSDTTSRLPPAPPARMKRSSSSSGSSVQSSVQQTPARGSGRLSGRSTLGVPEGRSSSRTVPLGRPRACEVPMPRHAARTGSRGCESRASTSSDRPHPFAQRSVAARA